MKQYFSNLCPHNIEKCKNIFRCPKGNSLQQCPFSGWTGAYCETKIDPCQDIDCGSNSYCALGLCVCTGTFTGPACDKGKLVYLNQFRLSHCTQVTSTRRHRPRSTLAQVMVCLLAVPSPYRNNVGLSSVRSSDIDLRAIWQGIPQPSITKISLKISKWLTS